MSTDTCKTMFKSHFFHRLPQAFRHIYQFRVHSTERVEQTGGWDHRLN